jgi:hypothetical protein
MLRRILRQWHAQISNLATTIQNNKVILPFLDTLEEFRDLALEKWNFRKIVLEHLENLLEQQRQYWKQSGRIKWDVLGDENTEFFHSTATINHNINAITMLKDSNGLERYQHEDKATIIWEAFKERLGTLEYTQMHFNLDELTESVPHLEHPVEPFSKEEIDNIVANMLSESHQGQMGLILISLKNARE